MNLLSSQVVIDNSNPKHKVIYIQNYSVPCVNDTNRAKSFSYQRLILQPESPFFPAAVSEKNHLNSTEKHRLYPPSLDSSFYIYPHALIPITDIIKDTNS